MDSDAVSLGPQSGSIQYNPQPRALPRKKRKKYADLTLGAQYPKCSESYLESFGWRALDAE
jgi:hypothetical protein